MKLIKKCDWDSNFFGYPVGIINYEEEFQNGLVKCLSENDHFKLVYVFAEAELSLTIPSVHLVDRKAIYRQSLHALLDVNELILVDDLDMKMERFEAHNHSYDQLLELALLSGEYSRFRVDKNFQNDEYTRLYSEWLRKSVDRTSAIETLIANVDNEILGFITLGQKEKGVAEIGLIAVSPKHRGKRIASRLIFKAIQTAFERGFSEIQVVTQQDNFPAIKLYEKLGFKKLNVIYIYHYWNL